MNELKDPDLLKVARSMGFKGKVLMDLTEPFSISFVSDSCYMCDKPWTVKCGMESESKDEPVSFYLCDEHLKHAQEKWPRPIHIFIKRIDIWRKNVKGDKS